MRTGRLTFIAIYTLTAATSQAATRYVDVNNPAPTAPYTNWASAATTIQDAVDAAEAGDEVLVTNGVYRTGGRTVNSLLTNRVAVTKPLTLRSVNGPLVTIIAGYQLPGALQGYGTVRCVYLADGARLSGFTLTGGATLTIWGSPPPADTQGAGVWCESANATVSNCILTSNAAFEGGGAWGGQLVNCALLNNQAILTGGGAENGTLNQCTLTGNSAAQGGGSAYSTLNNSIVYYNSAPSDANHFESTLNYSCTTPLPMVGTNNLETPPELASAFRLSPSSPCRGRGNPAFATGLDLDGEAWASPPAMGCDEYHAGAVTGALTVAIAANFTNVVPGIAVSFDAHVSGRCSDSRWELDDGTIVSNQLVLTRSWPVAGEYPVGLRAFNGSNPTGVLASVTISVWENPVQYVAQNSPNPSPPYLTWATAATNIQDAVDAGFVTGTILVSNGVYQAGGRVVKLLTNRVVLDKRMTLRSVNGPAATTIQGHPVLGIDAVRCIYLANDTALEGFTLTQGATRNFGSWFEDWSGGGVWCESASARISNCVFVANMAADRGGGAFGGTLTRCEFRENSADFGGGAGGGVLNQCRLATNWAVWVGGGAHSSTLNRCLVVGNSASTGGGTTACTVNNSVIFGNRASTGSAGDYGSMLNHCTVVSNAAPFAGGTSASTVNNSVVYYNTAPSGPNYYGAVWNHCCTTPVPEGDGNFAAPPLFMDLAAGNLRLQSNSPCINAGDDATPSGATDMDGRARLFGGAVDVGAYEFHTAGLNLYLGWLQNRQLPTDGSADTADTDDDRSNNWQEWRAGTNPTNALSVLRMEPPLVGEAETLLRWASVTDRTYFLERATTFTAQPYWTVLATNLPGQADTSTYTDTDAIGLGPFFYRVGVGE